MAGFWERLTAALEAIPEEAKQPPADARVGAVLALFEDGDDGPVVVLTRRRRDLRSHPGQLSFPGGRVDEDETVEEAALREAEEEIALRRETVEIAGRGPTFFIPPSGFWVVPVVARWRAPHELRPNPWEVDEVLRVPLSTLLEEERWRYVPLSERGAIWAWDLGEDLLWGATAMMVAALLGVVDDGWSGGLAPEDLGEDRRVLPWEDSPLPAPRRRLSGVPEVPFSRVPVVTSEQVREIDRLLAEDGRVDVSQLLEQAGRGVTDAVRRLVDGDLSGATVTVLLGPGGTGDAGAATARLLTSAGATVRGLTVGEPRDPARISSLRSFGVGVAELGEEADAGDVVVDAILGLGARPPVHGPAEAAIGWLRRFDVPVVAVDLPSGVHPDEGLRGPCVTATVTVALGAPKPAHTHRIVRPYLGDVYLADLGIPAATWEAVGLRPVSVFGRAPLVRLVDLPAEGPTDRADASVSRPADYSPSVNRETRSRITPGTSALATAAARASTPTR